MKQTRIFARVFNHYGSIVVKRKEYLTLEEAIEYVAKDLSDTGEVEKIEHLEDGQVIKTIKNKEYKKPFSLETHRAAPFMRHP